MPVQSYNINTRDAVAGVLYGMQQTRADIQTFFCEAEVGFGRAVQDGTLPKHVIPGAEAHVLGISLRSMNRMNQDLPSTDGFVTYLVGDAAAICMDGRVNVRVEGAGGVVRGAPAYILPTGKFTPVATGAVQATNVVWGETKTLANDDITHVVITNADVAPVV